ncbi:hypothetical protein EC844_12811 [Acinetobacter calcoaceticus]|uniref:Uncharacterized protein n=1 Tax=Acinetobacter calcoaceticus TaxID=471 RepID=A0A4R1XP65_ACICA|nr:hypothetical protein EC844_12811 [Acinetobacter calcoaceticus]
MSYKHNDLRAMRQNYWCDEASDKVQSEKQFLQQLLNQHGIFQSATLEDAKYLFFSLPSIIIVKGYALGFMSQMVQQLLTDYIVANKDDLAQRKVLKIQFRI